MTFSILPTTLIHQSFPENLILSHLGTLFALYPDFDPAPPWPTSIVLYSFRSQNAPCSEGRKCTSLIPPLLHLLPFFRRWSWQKETKKPKSKNQIKDRSAHRVPPAAIPFLHLGSSGCFLQDCQGEIKHPSRSIILDNNHNVHDAKISTWFLHQP